MAAEAYAFLLKEDLKRILGVGVTFPGLEGKVRDAISKLEELSQRSVGEAPQAEVLTSMHGLEDAIETYRIRRTRSKWKLKCGYPFTTSNASSSFSTNFFQLQSLWSQMQLRQAINKLLKDFRNVKAQSINVGGPPLSDSLTNRGVPTWDVVSHSQKMGWEEDVEETMISHLIDKKKETLNVLPVLIGSSVQDETEVVMSVYNSAHVKRHFEVRAWVYLSSQGYELRHILVDLIHQGTMSRSIDLDHMKEEALQDMLFKMLMDKRYLIVFTNVSSVEAWSELVLPLPDCNTGSSVVITTQNTYLASIPYPFNPPMKLGLPLTCEDSLLLLLKHVNPTSMGNDYDYLKEDMMQKCQGIPTAIILLGGVLYNKQPTEWAGVIKALPDMEDDAKVVKEMFLLSFHDLHPVLKVCLIYLILFPEELEIPVRRLVHLWLAEGFFNTQDSPPEDAAEIYLKELINRKLIMVTNWKLDGRPKTCRMPRLIRDILQNTTLQTGLFDSESAGSHRRVGTEPQKLRSRRFVEHSSHGRSNNNSVLDQTNRHLHSYVSFNTQIRGTANTEIGNFLRVLIRKTGFALLRVLDLEGVYKPQLPNTIGTLLLLKFLGLRLTVLDSIPESIFNLPLLETLDLKHTNVSILPSCIWKSKSLRHLYVSEARLDGSIRKTSTGPLINFQTIRGLYIVDKSVVSSVLERFVSLRKVGITCNNDSIDEVITWISKLSNLQTLKLRSLDQLGKPYTLPKELQLEGKKINNLYLLGKIQKPVKLASLLPTCLRKLTLSSSQIDEESAMESLGALRELVLLRLLAYSYTRSHMSFSNGKFPKLRGLKLWMLSELKELKVEKGALSCLEELEIRKCDEVKTLDGLEHLTCLNEIVLTSMPTDFVKDIKETYKESQFLIRENSWKFPYYKSDNNSKHRPHPTQECVQTRESLCYIFDMVNTRRMKMVLRPTKGTSRVVFPKIDIHASNVKLI